MSLPYSPDNPYSGPYSAKEAGSVDSAQSPAANAANADRYAVIGNPIEHSQSPLIHAGFAAQTGENISYTRMLAPKEKAGFAAVVRDFITCGGRGLNVTLPFKLDAYALANTLSPRAAAAGSVNTLCMGIKDKGGELYGDNTDGIGLVRDLEGNLNVTLRARRILLLGAGGAARGVLLPLIDAKPADIVIVNRTAARATELADRFAQAAASAGCRLIGGGHQVARDTFDLVINATSGSLYQDQVLPEFDPAALTANTLAYDMVYGSEPTIFMRYAETYNARIADGLGMLVEQAAESFFIWRGVRPESRPILAALRNAISTSNPF